jgi:hypothetical protein
MVKLTKPQKSALNLIQKCVTECIPLSWDLLVLTYYQNVAQTAEDYKYVSLNGESNREWYRYDLLESYKNQDHHWKYHVRTRIKGWFTSTIGVLVLKNKIFIVPVIEIE